MTLKGERQGLEGLLQLDQVTSHTACAQKLHGWGGGQQAWIGLSVHHLTSPLHRPAPALFLGPGVKSSAFCPWKPPSRPLFIRRPGPLDHQRGARGPLPAFFLSFFHLLPLLDPLVWSGPSRFVCSWASCFFAFLFVSSTAGRVGLLTPPCGPLLFNLFRLALCPRPPPAAAWSP
ncbi:hypothetical protein H0G86_006232 [Trichoderma simmonsii]|uniref:Uncharacterized protein n=1 Tax=Trichoderma simmonsii TaxID=1491479 RepID=A0A8G0LG94_9HYPO|nr:hypothetical protein H0G86_006232 [Trichoderma simmonsii]